MTINEIKEKTRDFLSKYINDSDLEEDRDFFADGALNSLFAMQLVMFVEKTFNIKVENEDLGIKNFNSINAIANLVNSKFTLTE